MTIQEMHYDFKQKLNKIDSEQNRNLKIPEIDWKLNEALEIFIKSVAQPRIVNHLGFEFSQRNIDDIRTLVIEDFKITPIKLNDKEYYVNLPDNYMFYISSDVLINKNNCGVRKVRTTLRQHDDDFEKSPFDISSYEWREVNIRFYEKGIKIITDGTFSVESLILNYIKKHPYIHNAQDFLPTKVYSLPSGLLLQGSQDCELPNHTHREIVDIAVYITSNDLALYETQSKQAKLTLNQFA